jgi:hypothetical protein
LKLDCEFVEVFIEARLKKSECAQFLGVDPSTLRRWLNEKPKAPKCAVEALRMLAGFTPRLSRRGKDFHGWRFKDGMLWTDEGMSFTPAQIRSIWHVDQLLKGQTREINELQAVISDLKDNIAPSLPDNVIRFPVHRTSGAA